MKKLLLLLLVMFGLKADPLVEYKLGYYRFSDSNLRKIYGDGALDQQLTFTYPVWNVFNCYFSIEEVRARSKNRMRPFRVEIALYPISLGFECLFPIHKAIDYYFSLGPRFIIYHQKNHRPTIANRMDKNGFGGFANTGFIFHFLRHFVVDVYGEYSYRVVHYEHVDTDPLFLKMFPSRKVQIGGIAVGAGIGYLF